MSQIYNDNTKKPKRNIPVEMAENLANLNKFREIYNIVFFMQTFMRNLMVHLIKFFCLGKNVMSKNLEAGIFLKICFLWMVFYGVLKWQLWVEYLLELEGKLEFIWDNIFSEL